MPLSFVAELHLLGVVRPNVMRPEPLCNQQHSQATKRSPGFGDQDVTLLHGAEMWSHRVLANDNTASGVPVAKFSVATNERFKDRQGQWQDRTEWHHVVAWQRLAEIVGVYCREGSKLYVEGKLQTSSWDDRMVERNIARKSSPGTWSCSVQKMTGRKKRGKPEGRIYPRANTYRS